MPCTYYWEHYSYPTGFTQVGELQRDMDVTLAKLLLELRGQDDDLEALNGLLASCEFECSSEASAIAAATSSDCASAGVSPLSGKYGWLANDEIGRTRLADSLLEERADCGGRIGKAVEPPIDVAHCNVHRKSYSEADRPVTDGFPSAAVNGGTCVYRRTFVPP